MGIDLPLKALVWQDEAGNTRLGYYNPGWLARRHGVPARLDPALETMSEVLAAVAADATRAEA
jgi:uncharacterized protein (DUF302 family)